jgi:hypothetical protein
MTQVNKTLIPLGFHGLIKQRATKSYEGMEAQLQALTPTKERCVIELQSRSRCLGGKKNLLPLKGIEP